MNRQEKLIAEIHAEFDTAQDRLLCQANTILSKPIDERQTAIESVGERLARVGFTNTPTVKKANEIKERKGAEIKKVVETREQAETIQYYQANYPFLKFLTEAELDRICKKYKLVYAPSHRYTEEVPEKNLRDIETAQVLDSIDVLPDKYFFRVTKYWRNVPQEIKDIIGEGFEFTPQYTAWRNTPFSDSTLQVLLNKAGYKGVEPEYIYNKAIVECVNKSGLFIAAPETHFNTEGLKKKGLGFFSVFETEIKDPIVFRYVRGGVQVLTKWGLEANDPDLVVPKLN